MPKFCLDNVATCPTSWWRHQMETCSTLLGFVRGIHRRIPRTKPVTLSCFLWSAPWINGWVNNHEAGDLKRQRVHYDVIIMIPQCTIQNKNAHISVLNGALWDMRQINFVFLRSAYQTDPDPILANHIPRNRSQFNLHCWQPIQIDRDLFILWLVIIRPRPISISNIPPVLRAFALIALNNPVLTF